MGPVCKGDSRCVGRRGAGRAQESDSSIKVQGSQALSRGRRGRRRGSTREVHVVSAGKGQQHSEELQAKTRKAKKKIWGRVRLCGGRSGPRVEPGQCPSISFNCERWASQVQLIHLLLKVSSLTGASLLLDVPWWWTMDVPREAVDRSREGRCISVCMRSCPTLFGGSPTWDLHLRELLGTSCCV